VVVATSREHTMGSVSATRPERSASRSKRFAPRTPADGSLYGKLYRWSR
jgi:hypothetical protein